MTQANSLPRLQVGTNRHLLTTVDGAPFFWLADTGWELFHRLNRSEAERYFATRQRQRFNVIQAVALAEFDGLHTPNVYGETPLINDDPTQPNEAYFAYVDELIELAARYDLYIGLLPTWGDKVNHGQWGVGPVVFTVENARVYGEFLGRRYADQSNVVWILGGDRPAIHEQHNYLSLWASMAAGIDAGAGFRTLKTYHPNGRQASSTWLHNEDWLDFNMMQSGHGGGRDAAVWDKISHDYELQPVKPTLDGEPNYEDHPVNPGRAWDGSNGYFRDYDVRKQLYRSVFAGGCGVTYGHHAVWQFNAPPYTPINHVDRTWQEAIERPGANQVQFLRNLIESRPQLTRIPDQNILVSPAGAAESRVQATRDAEGSYAFVYVPSRAQVTIELGKIGPSNFQAWWYNPRTGAATAIGEVHAHMTVSFVPPVDGPDWVLVLDASTANFAAPGVI